MQITNFKRKITTAKAALILCLVSTTSIGQSQEGKSADAAHASGSAGSGPQRTPYDWSNKMPDLQARQPRRDGTTDDSAIMRYQPIDMGANRRIDPFEIAKKEAARLEAVQAEANRSTLLDKAQAAFHDDLFGTVMRSVTRPTYTPVPGFTPNYGDAIKRLGAMDEGELQLLGESNSPEHQSRLEWEIEYLREQRRQQYIGGPVSGVLAGLITKLPWLLGCALILWGMFASFKRASGAGSQKVLNEPVSAPTRSDLTAESQGATTRARSRAPNRPDFRGQSRVSAFAIADLCVEFYVSPPSVSQRSGLKPFRRFLSAARVFAEATNTEFEVYALETGAGSDIHFCCYPLSGDHENLGDGAQLKALPVFEAAVLNAVCEARGLHAEAAKRLRL